MSLQLPGEALAVGSVDVPACPSLALPGSISQHCRLDWNSAPGVILQPSFPGPLVPAQVGAKDLEPPAHLFASATRVLVGLKDLILSKSSCMLRACPTLGFFPASCPPLSSCSRWPEVCMRAHACHEACFPQHVPRPVTFLSFGCQSGAA